MTVPLWTVIVKNNGISDVSIEDLGITISAGSSAALSDFFTFDEISSSDDLRTKVASGGDIVVNDGITDLSAENGEDWISIENIKDVRDNHYTISQLTTPGSASVDWQNVANAPDFGALHWREPAYARVLGFFSVAPTGASEGDFYVDTDDDYIYKYISSVWTPVVTAGLEDTRVINLSAALEDVYEYSAGSWSYSYTPSANFAINVQDDGDGKQAQYIYTPSDTWAKMSDVDFAAFDGRITSLETSAATLWNPHLDGGPNKHDASEIDVEGTYPYLGAPTDAETAFGNIDTHIGNLATVSGAAGGLDDAYDYPTPGGGRKIDVDAGSVQLSAGDGGYAPLELSDLSTAPLSGLDAGQLAVVNGLLYAYDNTRGKWLSIQRMTYAFGRRGNSNNQYLNHFGGNIASNNAGQRIPRNATIVSLAAQFDASATTDVHVRKNDNTAVDIATLSVVAAAGDHDNTVDVDLTAGDFLQSYIDNGPAQDPMFIVEVAWRV